MWHCQTFTDNLSTIYAIPWPSPAVAVAKNYKAVKHSTLFQYGLSLVKLSFSKSPGIISLQIVSEFFFFLTSHSSLRCWDTAPTLNPCFAPVSGFCLLSSQPIPAPWKSISLLSHSESHLSAFLHHDTHNC